MRVATDARSAVLVGRLDVGARPDLLESFPFPHELTLEYRLDADRADRGHHGAGHRPAPGAGVVRLAPLPAPAGRAPQRRCGSCCRPVATSSSTSGASRPATGHKRPAEAEPLGSRTFDDLYALARDRRLGLEGGGHSLRLLFDRNYGYAQVYAPADQNFVALEPMTAPVDALVSGACPFVSPGQTFTARFSIAVA